MKKVAVLTLLGLGLALGACNKTENDKRADALDSRADAIRDSGEATADAMEDRADKLDTRIDGVDSPAEQNLENKADQVRHASPTPTTSATPR